MHGTSAARITFLRKLLEQTKTTGLMATGEQYYLNASNPGDVYLWYFDYHCVAEYEFPLPEKGKFRMSMVDPWEMTVTAIPGTFSGKSKVSLSGKPYMAVLVEKV